MQDNNGGLEVAAIMVAALAITAAWLAFRVCGIVMDHAIENEREATYWRSLALRREGPAEPNEPPAAERVD